MVHLTAFNIGIVLVVAIGSFAYGFGFAVFITAIGEPGFYAYFKLDCRSLSESPYHYVYLPLKSATDPYTAT